LNLVVEYRTVSVKFFTTSNVNSFIEDSKKLIGTEVEEWSQPGYLVATQPALRGFCNVIGEYNPLYIEPSACLLCRYRGLPGPFDHGLQRCGYHSHLLMN